MRKFVASLMVTALAVLPGNAALSQDSDQISRADNGLHIEQGRSPGWHFGQHKKMQAALAGLKPQRKGVVDAFVIVAGLDTDPVFGREAVETGKVLASRYDAVGRTITLVAGADLSETTVAATPANLATILGGVAEKMDLKEDVLILYTTSHGSPGIGVVFNEKENGIGLMSPKRMATVLDGLGFKRRLLMISACFSGQFIPALKSSDSVIVTAASAERSSFGCNPGNDWTFFGDALINGAMRSPRALDVTVKEAFSTISTWENTYKLKPSEPQFFTGDASKSWLEPLEKRMPKAVTQRVGKPAIEALK